jgi:hypothetical protein
VTARNTEHLGRCRSGQAAAPSGDPPQNAGSRAVSQDLTRAPRSRPMPTAAIHIAPATVSHSNGATAACNPESPASCEAAPVAMTGPWGNLARGTYPDERLGIRNSLAAVSSAFFFVTAPCAESYFS